MIQRFNFIYRLMGFFIGVGLLLLFWVTNSIGAKTVFLFFGLGFLLIAMFRRFSSFIVSLPDGPCKRLASALAGLVASIYYLFHGQSVVWIAFAWILVFVGFLGIVAALQWILNDIVLLDALLKAHQTRTFPKLLGTSFAYIHAEHGFGVFYSHRISAKIMHSLWKYRSIPSESGLSVFTGPQLTSKRTSFLWIPRQRAIVNFLVSDSVRRYSLEFRKWLARQASAFIVLRTPFGLRNQSFDEEAGYGFQLCHGPTFNVIIHPRGKGESSSSTEGEQKIEVDWGARDSLMEDLIAPLTDRLVSTAVPTAASDSRLPDDLRSLIDEIATYAMPPVADCYLRFRLARSDVERFLSLLDGIESLIKCSVIVLFAHQWKQQREDVRHTRLSDPRPPTLGTWVGLLGKLVEKTQSSGVDSEICGFWKGKTLHVQTQLISDSKGSGLLLPEIKTPTQLGWINWVNDFRNLTKGHGVLKEESVAPLWHSLHETFLGMVSGLRQLTLSSFIMTIDTNEQIPVRGWRRREQRFGSDGTYVLLKPPSSELILLHPFMIIRSNNVLVWDCVREKGSVEFLNYASGERQQFETEVTDPYILWKRASNVKPFIAGI